MNTYKKIIVLKNSKIKNYNGSAILTLTKYNNSVMGNIKVFNITRNLNLVLGLAQNNKQIFKQNISLINNNTYSFKLNNINLNENISAVLVEDQPDKVIPLIWGSDYNTTLNSEIIENLSVLKQSAIKTETTQKKPLNLDEMFDISDVETEINNNLNFETINTFELEQLSNNQTTTSNNLQPENFITSNKNIIDEEMETITLEENETFYESISNQIENLFNNYPAETNLEELIPNSKWVKIDYENNGNFYVLGLIYEDITLKYICYGVPGQYSNSTPEGLDSYSQWLPTNANNPNGEGYWVMYQDAISGNSVMLDAI